MDNRQLIMNSALTLFYESGYDAVGVQQIVDSAGVSKPTLYYYFGSKQGLLKALLNEHFQPMEQKLIEASETGKNIPEKLYRIARAFFNGASEDPKFHMLMMALFYSGRKSEGFIYIETAHHTITSAITGHTTGRCIKSDKRKGSTFARSNFRAVDFYNIPFTIDR